MAVLAVDPDNTASDVWAVGYDYGSAGGASPLLANWDGTKWTGYDVPDFGTTTPPVRVATGIGLMAQDVEKTTPGAVIDINGYKAVDYRAATEASRKIHQVA